MALMRKLRKEAGYRTAIASAFGPEYASESVPVARVDAPATPTEPIIAGDLEQLPELHTQPARSARKKAAAKPATSAGRKKAAAKPATSAGRKKAAAKPQKATAGRKPLWVPLVI